MYIYISVINATGYTPDKQ